LSAEKLPRYTHTVVQRLRQAGAMPLAGVGQHAAHAFSQRLSALLGAALHERQGWVPAATRVLIDVAHPHVRLQDALSVLTPEQEHKEQEDQEQEQGQGQEGGARRILRLIVLRANALADLKSPTPQALPDKLIDIWLLCLACAAMGQPLSCVVVGANAVLRVPPQEPVSARAQLQLLLATWAEGMRWPLPLPPALALLWLQEPNKTNALLDLYEGSSHQGSERDKDPALARTYPTLNALMAHGDFARLAEAVYAPLRDWAEKIQVEALPEAQAVTSEGSA